MPSHVPQVSVVLPVRNAAGCIGRAVRSVVGQTLDSWELVVVDDGSSDGSAKAALDAAPGDPRVRLVGKAHDGLVAALETGLAAARGRFIARMDADDEMMPDRLAGQAAFLRARPDLGVVGCLVAFGGDAVAAEGYARHVAWINDLVEPDEIARSRFVESPLAHPSVMFRRELVGRHGGYRESGWPEDYELWLRWMDAGVRFGKVRRVLLRWNDPPDRLSRTHPHYAEAAFYACKCHYLARWIRREVPAGRRVLLWGAGRVTRKRFAALEQEGVALDGFIDVDAKKTGRAIAGRRVLGSGELPPPGRAFVVGAVATRGARELIRASLEARGYAEGVDFVMAA